MISIHKVAGENLVLGSKVMLMCGYCHLAADLFTTGGLEIMTREEFISNLYCEFRGLSTLGRKVVLKVRDLQAFDLTCLLREACKSSYFRTWRRFSRGGDAHSTGDVCPSYLWLHYWIMNWRRIRCAFIRSNQPMCWFWRGMKQHIMIVWKPTKLWRLFKSIGEWESSQELVLMEAY